VRVRLQTGVARRSIEYTRVGVGVACPQAGRAVFRGANLTRDKD